MIKQDFFIRFAYKFILVTFPSYVLGNGTIISIVYDALFEMTDKNSTGSLS